MKILCDTREQAPYTFDRYQGVTVERAALQTCDYSLAGLHDHIGLERKSLDDLTEPSPRAGNASSANVNAGGDWTISG